MKRFLPFALASLLVPVSQVGAQSLIHGTVVDARTGETLTAATIHVEGTYRGTITNVEGAYQLNIEQLPAKVVVRYIGYDSELRAIPATAGATSRQDFRLQPVVYESEQVVITGEDPAVRIMREVIKRKKVWREALETYQAIAYNRFAISNDTGIVSIMETVTEAFWDKEQGIREVLKARRETSNMEIEEALPAALLVTNLYDDDIEISGHKLMGVTHPDALSDYHFRLEATRKLGHLDVYDISVEPKSRTKTAFVGRVSVLDSAYALIDVELRPGEAFLFPPPFERFDVTYQQQFSNFGGDFWLPVDFRAEMELKLSFGVLLSFPTIVIEQTSRFTDYDVNAVIPDSLFEDDSILFVDSMAVASDSLLETGGVAVPLSQAEQAAYVDIDSTMKMVEAFAPTGLLARFVDINDDDDDDRDRRHHDGDGGDVDGSGGKSGGPLDQILTDKSAVPDVWYNRVDQFHVGGEARLELFDRLKISGGGGYNIAPDSSDRWTYQAGVRLPFGPNRRAFIQGEYSVGSVKRYDSELYDRVLNSAVVVLGGSDYFDYYWRDGFTVGAGYDTRWHEASVLIEYRDEDHSSLARTVDKSPIGSRELRPNPAIEEGRLRAVSATVSVGDAAKTFGAVGRNRLLLQVEHGGADFDYTRYALAADAQIWTFFRRRLIPNSLDVHISAGTSSGGLPTQRLGVVEGSLGPYRPFGGLRSLSDYPYEGDTWVTVVWEHSFRTVPFELVGFRSPARKGYNVIVFGGHGRTWLSDSSLEDLEDTRRVSNGWHHEVGLSLSGLFGVVRLDLAKRIDAAGFTVGFAVARLF